MDIADADTIVRAVFYPQTLDRKGESFKLRKSAFQSPPGEDEVSVIRRDYVDDAFCKDKAKEIELLAKCRGENRKEFRGFAVVSAQMIRQLGSTVEDSRQIYVAHADIRHGFVVERNEPLPSKLNDRLDSLRKGATFIRDPRPNRWTWVGPPITLSDSI